MARYIDADVLHIQMEDLYEHHIEMHNFSADGAVADCLDLLDNAPTADVVEVKHGEWMELKELFYDEEFHSEYPMKCYKCSECDRVILNKEPYCNCGAKMDERSKQSG